MISGSLKRINELIKGINRGPFESAGKPEHSKHDIAALWYRRINETSRITHKIMDDIIAILVCEGHYNSKPKD